MHLRHSWIAFIVLADCLGGSLVRAETPRCRIVPLPSQQVQFLIDGQERLRWHFGPAYPRPFFHPLIGPAGVSLTRMGHPGAPDHDHHRSIWFAHADVDGEDFWSDQTAARIRQKQWLVYEDGEREAVMAVLLGWYDSKGRELMEQELVAVVRPAPASGLFLELQSTFRTAPGRETKLNRTPFGFLAVRVAKTISAHFGSGRITNSEGVEGEPGLFGQPASWMDYSGPVPVRDAGAGGPETENGITYFDHPGNPGFPARWHVRADGWMGASTCRTEGIVLTGASPLVIRHLLHAHPGRLDPGEAKAVADSFRARPLRIVIASQRPHQKYELKE